MTRILIVFTGGTIGSESGNKGFHPSKSKQQIETILNLSCSYITPNSFDLVDVQPINTLSENLHPEDWEKLCVTCLMHAESSKADGILILHGTDTLAYTATVFSLFEHISKRWPVVLSGANKPVIEKNSDGPLNVAQSLTTLKFLTRNNMKGCYVVFNGSHNPKKSGKIFLASRVKKFAWSGHCFRNFNIGSRSWIGEVNSHNVTLNRSIISKVPTGLIFPDIRPVFDVNSVEYHTIHPGFNPNHLFRITDDPDVKAVILALYNSGTGPTEGLGSIRDALLKLKTCNKTVFAVSQHEGKGGMTMNNYETSITLRDCGVVSLSAMMLESAIPKLMLAMGNFHLADDVIKYMLTSVSYEI